MSLTKCFIPILSFWEWEVWITSEICARVGSVLHDNQLLAEKIKELSSPKHLLTTPELGISAAQRAIHGSYAGGVGTITSRRWKIGIHFKKNDTGWTHIRTTLVWSSCISSVDVSYWSSLPLPSYKGSVLDSLLQEVAVFLLLRAMLVIP